MKVAIYTRVSGKSNRQDAANQSLQLIEYCQRQGWEYVEYTDRMSGTKAERTAFQQLFEDARLKKLDLVLFWALDRFSREGVTETLNYLKVLDSYGVAWKSFTESYLDSTGMFKEAVIAILAAVAKQEHARLSERVVAGLRRAKREGKVLGRKRIIVDRDRIHAMHANGHSVRAISTEVGISKSLVANILNSHNGR
jgi:DNA invertase Pin-like site-specific DNA recombinase